MQIPGYEIDQTFHASQRHEIHAGRRLADNRRVALKCPRESYPDARALARLRHEYHHLQRLADRATVPEVYGLKQAGAGNLALVTAPAGESLARILDRSGPPSLGTFLTWAIEIARTLEKVHEQDLVHKNLCPRHLLLSETCDEVRLIDFAIASQLCSERQAVTPAQRLEGPLPYLAPEQTGRINLEVDYRSDYYALGVTLFELATGKCPFDAADALEWVHAHIGRQPPDPREFRSDLPEPVAGILLKLLAKTPRERYQSSHGLIADLSHCRDGLQEGEVLTGFHPGSADVSRQFRLPQKLYGRERELQQLMTIFHRSLRGASELCLISGAPGVGKSALVHELGGPLVEKGGYLLQGKFDQYSQQSPYSALAQAFRGFARQLLGEPSARLEAWRDAIQEAVGHNGRLLTDLIPELEEIIGEQPAVSELGPGEARNRFRMVFRDFVRVIARPEHPLVIFLDDLQWSDAPTLDLLSLLFNTPEPGHLFLIGAYRDTEVDAGHPLTLTLAEIEQGQQVERVRVTPLGDEPIASLVADTLGTDPETAAPLSGFLAGISEGNPFFLSELLRHLHREQCIWFSSHLGRWDWDLATAKRAGIGPDVVEFLVHRLRELPRATQSVLELAACIGNRFDLETLAVVSERPVGSLATDLLGALERNVVLPESSDYKYMPMVSTDSEAANFNARYRFAHDRLQQAAYTLIEEDRRERVHLSIGRLMRDRSDPAVRRERVTEIVGHLNAGRGRISDTEEQQDLAGLNLEAGIRARESTAYRDALEFLEIGRHLLGADGWEVAPQLMMSLEREYQQCAYLVGDTETAEQTMEDLLAHADNRRELADLLATRTRQLATLGRMGESIRCAIRGLHQLGIEVAEEPDSSDIAHEREQVEKHRGGRSYQELLEAEPLRDPDMLIAIRLLMEIFPAAFLSGSGNLFPLLVLKSVNLSLRHGNSPESAFAYAGFGMVLCGGFDEPRLGHEYGRLGVALNERLEDLSLRSRIIYVYTMFIHHWNEHWSSMTPWFRRGIEAGYQSGDLLYLAYSAQDCIIWDPTRDLETACAEHAEYLEIVRETGYQDSIDSATLFLQMQKNFLGRTEELCSMDDEHFREVECLAGMRARNFMTGIANYHIYKGEIALLYGDYHKGLEHVKEMDGLIDSSMSLPQSVRLRLVCYLTRAALWKRFSPDERETAGRRMQEDRAQMARWAQNFPPNYFHLERLMAAEAARLEGDLVGALQCYEQAREAAAEHGWLRDQAMTCERAARCLHEYHQGLAAEGWVRTACQLYEQWGAVRKVGQLRREFPWLAAEARERAAEGSIDSSALDLASLMKAARAISGQMRLEQLWQTTMRIILENAGGRSASYVIERDGHLVRQAAMHLSGEHDEEHVAIGEEATPDLPESLIHRTLRDGQARVVEDLSEDPDLRRDSYVRRTGARSAMCIPMRHHGRPEGVLYLENNLVPGAFTRDRLELVELLSAQAAISMENARLYEEQIQFSEAQRRFVPEHFLNTLDHPDITGVQAGEYERREMSVLFADLRGFTGLAESLAPQGVIELLNRYFRYMEAPILEGDGFINEFTGDEIMGLFGAHPEGAIRAGIGMFRALETFNERSRAQGGPELAAGIGINSGPLVMGTVGTGRRIQCAVVGDTVNTGSRVEQLNKTYGTRLLVSEGTVRRLGHGHGFNLRRIDRIQVRGRQEAMDLFEVLDAETAYNRERRGLTRDTFEQAVKDWLDGRIRRASAGFESVVADDPHDAVARAYLEKRLARPGHGSTG